MKHYKQLEDALFQQQFSAQQRVIKGLAVVDPSQLEGLKNSSHQSSKYLEAGEYGNRYSPKHMQYQRFTNSIHSTIDSPSKTLKNA